MKNTTFRKKALLSSVAMLLVALVALGSATFAWFTANPDVDAEGLKMTTTAAAGLVGISASEVTLAGKSSPSDVTSEWWDHDIVLRATYNDDNEIVTNPTAQDLQPVSGIGTSKYTIPAAEDFEKDADETKSVSGSNAFYSEKMYFKSTDDTAVEHVYFKGIELTQATTKTIANALRVEVIAGGNVLGTYGFDGVGNAYLTKEGSYSAALAVDDEETDGVDESKYVCEVPAASFANAIDCGSIAKNGMLEVTVNVYLDGEHESCYSRNAINVGDIISYMNLHFSANA